jgi:hypothetical protein
MRAYASFSKRRPSKKSRADSSRRREFLEPAMRSKTSSSHGSASDAKDPPDHRGPSFDDYAASAADPRPGISRRQTGVRAGHRDGFDIACLRTIRAHRGRRRSPIPCHGRRAACARLYAFMLAAACWRAGGRVASRCAVCHRCHERSRVPGLGKVFGRMTLPNLSRRRHCGREGRCYN